MRGGSRAAAAALAFAVAAGAGLAAHRRDEHLQAARIGIEPDHVTVDLDVTPGADLADAAIAAIDRDADGVLSPSEREACATAIAGALWLAHDREAHALRVESATFPDLWAIRRGEGTIALRLRAALRPEALAGAHQLIFGNGHQPAHSVYLANALVPRSPRVAITSQRRSVDQHEIAIGYELKTDGPPRWVTQIVTAGAAVALMLLPLTWRLVSRRRR